MYSSVVTDREDLPERLRNIIRDPSYEARVNWAAMEISLQGGFGRRIDALFRKWPDELLEAGLQEDVGHTAELARFYEGDDLAAIVRKVLESDRYHAWRNLAVARPELAASIQEKLIAAWKDGRKQKPQARTPDLGDLEDFLLRTKDTDPELVQGCFIDGDDTGRLVDVTIRRPDRVPLRTTIALLLLAGRRNVIRNLEHLCKAMPEAVEVTQKVLLGGDVGMDTFLSVCRAIPGMDLDRLEEHVVSKWTRIEQYRFQNDIPRETGPLRDFLIAARIMEV